MLKKGFKKTVSKLDINFLKKNTSLNTLIPFHHLVSDEPVPYIHHLYKFKTTKQFEADLNYLLKHFEPVTVPQLIQNIKKSEPPLKKNFLITFDDGLKQAYDIAMPILLKKGVPAAFFFVPQFLDNTSLFYDLKKGLIIDHLVSKTISNTLLKQAEIITAKKELTVEKLVHFVRSINFVNRDLTDNLGSLLNIDFEHFLKARQPFMTSEQVADMQSKGFFVGAHSMDHPLYKLITLDEQIQQTEQSLNWVSNTFNPPNKIFAFPHVDTGVSKAFFDDILNKTKPKADLIFGNQTGMLENNPFVIHRFIGENPDVSIETTCKSILGYNMINKALKREYVKRPE